MEPSKKNLINPAQGLCTGKPLKSPSSAARALSHSDCMDGVGEGEKGKRGKKNQFRLPSCDFVYGGKGLAGSVQRFEPEGDGKRLKE